MRRDRAPAQRFTLLERLESRQLCAATPGGTLDKSFDFDGQARIHVAGGLSVTTSDVVVQADGKTVVVGTAQGFHQNARFAVARFNVDGSPDLTFGPNHAGTVLTTISDQPAEAHAVEVQADGKILVAGDVFVEDLLDPGHHEFAIARYLPNGALDKSFSGDGKATVRVDGDSSATAIAIQNDDKIVLVGGDRNEFFNNSSDFAIARLNANGSLDHSFSGDGKQIIGFGNDETAQAVAIDYSGSAASNPNYGKIVLAGTLRDAGAKQQYIALARLKTNGERDGTFGRIPSAVDTGTVLKQFPGHAGNGAQGMLIQPDGKIVVSGFTGDFATGPNTHFALVRFDATGKLDPTFGPSHDGRVTTSLGGNDQAFDIIRSADDGFIVGGTADGQFAVTKYSANGTLDTTFGVGGKVVNANLSANTARLTAGPGRRFTMAGGRDLQATRYLDSDANVITIGSFDVQASEQGANTANFIVARSERLPVPTRVYFSIDGTARAPVNLPFRFPDYTLDGMTVGGFNVPVPFIDIPADKTFAVVTLTPIDDTIRENTETATFTVMTGSSFEMGSIDNVTLTIADNDQVIAMTPTTAPTTTTMIRHAVSARKVDSLELLFSDSLMTESIA